MKKLATRLLLMMMAVACIVACNSSEKTNDKEGNDGGETTTNDVVDIADASVDAPASVLFDGEDVLLAAYLNIDDLLDKCDLTENQRKLLAAAAISDIEEADAREYVQNAIIDLDNTGIKLSEPVYATFNMGVKNNTLAMEAILVAEVSDVETLDMVVGKMGMPLDLENGVRYFNDHEEELYFTAGYNNDYLVLAISSENVSEKLFFATLNNADIDLAAFNGRDAAVYVDADRAFDVYTEVICMSAPKSQLEYDANYQELKKFIGSDAKAILGLAFQEGRIVLDLRYAGFNNNYLEASEVVSNENLQAIPSSAVGVVNVGVNGPAVADIITKMLTPELKRTLAREFGMSVNEISSMAIILCDVISSIEGDLTLALNNFNVEEKEVYEYGEVVETTSIDVEALLMANVTNNYIMENISLLPVKKAADGNSYYYQLGGLGRINIGQMGDTFYAGVNTSYNDAISNSIANKWDGEFDDSLAYVAIDMQNLVALPMIKDALSDLRYTEGREVADLVNGIIGLLDSAWLNVREDNTTELVITMKDDKTNALAQLFNLFASMAN